MRVRQPKPQQRDKYMAVDFEAIVFLILAIATVGGAIAVSYTI